MPAFLGSSFAYLGGFSAVAQLDFRHLCQYDRRGKAAYALGGIVIAGLMYLVLAALIRLLGVRKVMRYLPPVVTGPIIILIGLSLAPSAINNASTNWWLALLSIAVVIAANIWGKGMIKIIPILLGVVIPYVVALATNQVDFSGMAARGTGRTAALCLGQVRPYLHPGHGPHRRGGHDGAYRGYVCHLRHGGGELY